MTDLATGSELAGYRIEGVAGRGGMGVVYRATQLGLNRSVALKLIAGELAGDVRFRERFKRESEMAASIDHPNVLPVYEAGEADGQLFIAMRYVEGTDLSAVIAESGGLDPAAAVGIVLQVGAALDAAHRRGLIHRDVKPANVLVADEAERHVYLTDFGLTKRATSAGGLTKEGQFVGTLDYVPPEQIRGERADARADVYALGCLLFHTIAGRPPFERDSDVATMHAHLNDPPPALSEASPGVPAALDAAIEGAMAKDPAARPGSAGDFARAAKAALEGSAPATPRGSVATGAAAPAGKDAAAGKDGGPRSGKDGVPPSGPGGSPWPARARRIAGIGLPVIVALGIVAAVLAATGVLGGGDDEDDAAEPASQQAAPEEPAAAPAVAASIEVGDDPSGLAVDGEGNVWVVSSGDGTLARIDSKTNEVAGDALPAGAHPVGVTAGQGIVWVAAGRDRAVRRFQARPDLVAGGTIGVGAGPLSVSLGKQLVWVANSRDDTVERVDRASPTVVGAPIGVGREPTALFVGDGSVWVANTGDGTVSRIDPATAEVAGQPIRVGREPRAVVEGFGSVWVANAADDTVTRIDARTARPAGEPIRVGDEPRAIAAGLGSVWVANGRGGSVSRIDPKSGRLAGQEISVGSSPFGIAVGAGAVWVTNAGDATVTRIDVPGAPRARAGETLPSAGVGGDPG